MVTLFYTKIHNEFFIFLGVALHYTIYLIKDATQKTIVVGTSNFTEVFILGYMYEDLTILSKKSPTSKVVR